MESTINSSMVLIILQYGLQDVSMIIIGNKCDLERKRVVPVEFGEQVDYNYVIRSLVCYT